MMKFHRFIFLYICDTNASFGSTIKTIWYQVPDTVGTTIKTISTKYSCFIKTTHFRSCSPLVASRSPNFGENLAARLSSPGQILDMREIRPKFKYCTFSGKNIWKFKKIGSGPHCQASSTLCLSDANRKPTHFSPDID